VVSARDSEAISGRRHLGTKDEFKKLLFTGVQKQQRYMAEQNILYGLQKDMFKLGDEDPQLLRQVKQRIDDLMGRQGKSSKLINETFRQVRCTLPRG
jgi:hypothetical protein